MNIRNISNPHPTFLWESTVRRLIIFITVICALSPLILYLFFSLGEQKISISAEVDIFAHMITDEINKNPDYWQYEDLRFSSILKYSQHNENDREIRELFDNNNQLVAGTATSLKRPFISVETHVYDAGMPVGSLKITRSIRPIIQKSVCVFLLSSICGILVYFVLHSFPLKVLRSAFAALHKEKEQTTVTLNSITDAVITTDTSLRILSLNPVAAELAGTQPTEILGKPFLEHFVIAPLQTQEKIYVLLQECLKYGKNSCHLSKQYILIRRADGREFQIEITVSPLHSTESKMQGLVIVLHDVTHSHALEKQLKNKVQELSVILKYAGVGIAFAKDGVLQKANNIVLEILGVPKETILGQSVESILTSFLGYSHPIEHIYDHLSKGKIFDIEHQLVRADKKKFWLRLIGQAVDPNRIFETGTVWIAQDITQLKHQHEKLQLARHRAEEASRFKSEFLAHVNHELRNPLGGIIGLNQLLLETQLTPIQHRYLTIIQDTADNLLLLINNLLDLSRIEAGAMELEEKHFSIDAVYNYVNNVVSLDIKEKGLSLTLHTSDNVPAGLIGDKLRLGQILLNLINNAIRFTSSGEIQVMCENVEQAENTVTLRFSVKDSGCGIDESTQKTIFDAYVQASSSVARTHGGSGLGLSICKKLTELMGGNIHMESEPGKGSTFSFTCRFKYEKHHKTELHALKSKKPEQQKRPEQRVKNILFVDDIPFNQTVAKLLLEREGHKVQMMENGREALTALTQSNFDIVFMDVQMPVLDGLTATRLIRSCEKGTDPPVQKDPDLLKTLSCRIFGQHTPIIGMTGDCSEKGTAECLAAGMDNYISKPYERQEILRVIDTVCNEIT